VRILTALFVVVAMSVTQAQVSKFVPVTTEMLVNPSPDDWLMYSRTYDAQRFSPLKQINRQNAGQLREAWTHEMGMGTVESIPLVYRGVMYIVVPGSGVRALNATNGAVIWDYKRPSGNTRTKTLAIYDDLVFYTSPDGFIVAIDARTGELRWETKTTGGLTSGPIVVEGKVLTGRTCGGQRANCYVSAHDARTGKEVWKFFTAAGPGEPGGETWGDAPEATRVASTWGLPGSYDPARRLIYWGVANPTPNTRMARHGGNPDAIPTFAPADLYSNSTVALNPDTGKIAWYYQHLPGDDWDEDYTHERTLLRTAFNPDPSFVKWINPDVRRGQQRDIAVMVGEGGGIWALDRITGQFLWASPFPYDVRNFIISDIDVKTGITHLNTDLLFREPGQQHTLCFWNTRSYWPLAYHPGQNSLYVPFVDNCLDMTAATPAADGKAAIPERRVGARRSGTELDAFAGVAKVNMATGEVKRIYSGRAPGNGAMLATAGDLVFWGDLGEKFRAFDAVSGKILWEVTLQGAIQNSTITYAVNGKQYVAVFTGEGALTGGLIEQAGLQPTRRHNAVYVFALTETK
jgi:PQQ-dependent dehydrogenase (methanol/ethanol family)